MAVIRNALVDWRKYLVGVFTQVLANPVIGRELRVRVRVGRGYLLQAAYLAFMILIVALAYEWVVGDEVNLRNPFQMQGALVSFYYVVLGTLITLIVLIAPALTANAITLERERKTMELLLATPLTARHLLTGKLVASMAFVVLLLALTLPVNAVSVLLGGASFADLLKAYLIIASGAMVLCSIALFTSVYARNSTMAVLWSYVRVGAFLLATGVLTTLQGAALMAGRGGGGAAGVDWMFPVALLNPFSAIVAADTEVNLVRWRIPSWIVAVVVCLLFTRLTLTSAARKVGLYDKDVMPSLRRQLLVVIPLHVFLTVVPILTFAPLRPGVGAIDVTLTTILILLCVAPFLLLAGWIAPFGKDDDKECPNDGVFNPFRMFTAHPSGALPFLILLWAVALGALLFSLHWGGALKVFDIALWELFIATVVYFTGMWVLFWGIGRYASVLLGARSLVGARALALTLITAILTLPIILHITFFSDALDSPAMMLWILMPFFEAFNNFENHENPKLLFFWGGGMLLIGALLGLLTQPSRQASAVRNRASSL
ncbi:MAG: ABC transporter permease [Fimbriimonadales bacterium]|nr:ABC transporter permease [Fimbriimonadales bacterium]